ncbi:protein kinase domain-containing protein [Planctomicrobium sp. SH661]|uniref:serine/threonine-protein kinase n=1 Tax=Planctomicrobium sp. SH661 TaxID=3448124 RepID=UPI003F5C2895
MSELGFQQSTGSSNIGLTFIRPMPQGGSAPTAQDIEGSSVRGHALSLSDRLFPPRGLEESGAAPPVAGVELGHFVMEERIGRGGMGAVFRAVDKRLGRVVAIKVLTSEHSADPEAVLRFQNEARAAARLDHENIARVHYIGEEHHLHFIAFEFVMGENVRNLIQQRGHLTPSEAVNYTLQIAEALRHTSAANVVHRDIKPSNIIISPSGRAKLVDLGLARQSNLDVSRELTTVGTALGTFDYIAPEQALDARNVDVRSDIYSLGCTLYHMLIGTPPYPTGTMFEKVMNHHRPVPPNPSEKNRHVSPQLAKIVQKMMAANPDERYATPDDLIDDLVSVAVSMGLQPTVPDAKIWQAPIADQQRARWNGFRTWSTVALLLVVIVLADRIRSIPAPRYNTLPGETIATVDRNDDFKPASRPGPSQAPELTTLGEVVPPVFDLPAKVPGIMPDLGLGTVDPIFSDDDNLISPLVNPPVASSALGLKPRLPGTSGEPITPPALESTGRVPSSSSSVPTETTATRTGPAMELPVSPPASRPMPTAEPMPMPVAEEPSRASMFAVVKPGSRDNPDAEERFFYPTLAAACAQAKDGWAVELPLDTKALTLSETIEINDRKIKIRPSRDFRPGIDPRPFLRVDLTSQLAMRSFSDAAQMLQIRRGGVELSDLDIEMIVDPTATEDWSIATLENGSRLAAQGVSFTMVNPGNSRAALVYVPASEVSESADLMPDRVPSAQNQVEFKDCICRGQFDFVVQENSPLSVLLQNTALALSGCMIRIDGSEPYLRGMETEEGRVTDLRLDHVTLVAARGLLNANSGDHGSLPQIQIEINDSVCIVFSDEQMRQPLLEVSGHEAYEVLLDQIVIKDNREASFIQLSGPFSLVDSTQTQLAGRERELKPDQLGVRNLRMESNNLLQLPTSLKLSDWHRVQQADLELRPDDDNPAIGVSGSLRNAGVDWHSSRLPSILSGNQKNEPAPH